MLESGELLKTWALDERPQPGICISATQLPDHRKAYLDYEGPVSDNRGSVSQWDCGLFAVIEQDEQHWIVQLDGRRLKGRAELRCSVSDAQRWTFAFTGVIAAI
jgi:hypothetical protein